MELKDIVVFVPLVLILFLDSARASIPKYYIEDHCDQMLNLNYGGVEVVRLLLTKDKKYPDGMRCRMIVQAPEGKRLMMSIEDLELDSDTMLKNPNTQVGQDECANGDYVLFMDGPDQNALPMLGLQGKVCRPPEQKSFLSSGRYIALFFASNVNRVSGSGMKLLITAFSDGPCQENQFGCKDNGICIKKSLECDGYSNCLDQSDEAMPKCLSTGAIIGIAISGTIMIILIIVIIVICVTAYQRRKRARIIKRAIDSGAHPYVVWAGSDTDVIIDPIKEANIRDYAALDNQNMEEEVVDTTLKDSVAIDPSRLQEAKGPPSNTGETRPTEKSDKDMIKYPSGFWDITLSDLGIKHVTEL